MANLSRQIRSKVHEEIQKSSSESTEIITGWKYLKDKKKNILVRIIWAVIIVMCLIITGYQFYERMAYFYTYPVVVNYEFTDMISAKMMPSTTICSIDTPEIGKLRMEHEEMLWRRRSKFDRYCLLDAIHLVDVMNTTADVWWSYLNTTDIITSLEISIAGRKIILDKSKSIENDILPFGTCSTLKYWKEVKFAEDGFSRIDSSTITLKKSPGSCMSSRVLATVQKQGMKPFIPMLFSCATGVRARVYALVKMYYFANTPNTPCSEDKDYEECYHKCLVNKYRNRKEITCKYPFLPDEIKLPFCQLKNDIKRTHESFVAMNNVLMKTHPIHDCKCPKLCGYFSTNLFGFVQPNNPNISNLKAYIGRGNTIITESRSYMIIDILCDFGGNLGLFLGFSLLTIVESFFSLRKQFQYKKRSVNKQLKIIHKKVIFYYNKIKNEQTKIDTASQDETFIEEQSIFINLMKFFAYFLCVTCCIYLIYDRVGYYFTYPTKTVVEINFNTTVTFPDVILCGQSNDILDTFQEYSIAFKKNKSYTCQVTLLDLLDHFSSEAIWNATSILKQFQPVDASEAENYFSMPLVKNFRVDEVYLPEGLCSKFSAGEQQFSGIITTLNLVAIFSEECSREQTTYLHLADDDIDLRNVNYVVMSVQVATVIEIKMVKHANVKSRPCVDAEIFKNCTKKCFNDRLMQSVPCLLPYMPKLPLQNCNNTEMGKIAEEKYKKIYATHFPTTKCCNCTKPCLENILYVHSTLENYKGPDISINSVFFVNNIFETYSELFEYEITKMLCDIGSLLGIALGLSILSILDLIYIFSEKCQSKFKLFTK